MNGVVVGHVLIAVWMDSEAEHLAIGVVDEQAVHVEVRGRVGGGHHPYDYLRNIIYQVI